MAGIGKTGMGSGLPRGVTRQKKPAVVVAIVVPEPVVAAVAEPVVEPEPAVVELRVELRIEDVIDDPRAVGMIPPPHDDEDPAYTPEIVEEEAPVLTAPLAQPPRPVPTVMNPIPAKLEPPKPPAPVVRRPGFLPARTTEAGTVPKAAIPTPLKPATAAPSGFASMRKAEVVKPADETPPVPEKEKPRVGMWDVGKQRARPRPPIDLGPTRDPSTYKNGKFLTIDDVPF